MGLGVGQLKWLWEHMRLRCDMDEMRIIVYFY